MTDDSDPDWRWHNHNRCGVLRKEHFTYTVWLTTRDVRDDVPSWSATVSMMRNFSITTEIAIGSGNTWQEAVKNAREKAKDEFLLLSNEV